MGNNMKVNKTILILTLGLFFSSLMSSCATIMNGTRQSIDIASNPSDALVYVDKAFVGKTPLVVKMTRGDNHLVKIELSGYEPYEVVLSKEVSGWVFGNIVIGGFFGLAIDAISGGIYTLTPQQIESELNTGHICYTKKSNNMCIFITLKTDPSWEKVDNLVAIKP
jgi:hypothetical protein